MNKITELKKEMVEYKSVMIEMKQKLNTMEKKYEKMNYRYREDIDRISHIMYNTEKKVVEDLGLSLYEYEPVRVTSGRKYYISSVTDKLLKLKVWRYVGEGEYWRFLIKIPLTYFDMTEEEIVKAHTEWSFNKISKREEVKKKQELIKKQELFNTLKKELGV